jgi:sugar phosphate isomerase/epimerase
MKKLDGAARELRVPAIRIDVVPRKVARDQFLPFAITACTRLVEQLEGTSIRLGIENHGNTTNDPAFLEALFKGVGSKRLGLTLHACNLYWFGHPLPEVYAICERFAGRAVHTHCKNIRYPEDQRNQRRAMGWQYERYAAPVNEGDIDYRRIADLLRRAHYAGGLCLENECLRHYPQEQHAGVLAAEVAFLRSVS